MIIKNHNIELKDTSASEMARFRQIMLHIWRQQIEDDKNSAEWEKYLKENTVNDKVRTNGSLSALTYILLWIKKNIGNKAKEIKLNTFPKNAFADSLSDTYKGHLIKCNRFLFETVVDLINIRFEASFRPVETIFLLDIFNIQKNLVFRFETKSYEGLEYLVKFIGYDIKIFRKTITQQYKKMFQEARNNKNKLDILYEVIPEFILQALKTDQEMYGDIWTLLDQKTTDILGRNENIGILNILKTLKRKNAKKLYEKLYERPLWVMRIYETFSGDERTNFVALLMTLSKEFNYKSIKENTSSEKQFAIIPDGYWLDKHVLETSWTSKAQIEIKGYGQEGSNLLRRISNALPAIGPTSEDNSILKAKPRVGTDQYLNEVLEPKLKCPAFVVNPMDFVAIRSIATISEEETLIEETQQLSIFLKYTTDELNDKVFWDVVNVATTLAGGSGAARVLLLEGTGWLLKTAAIAELSKTALDLVMLNDNAKKALKKAGLGILVDNWATISITSDLAFLSLDGLFALAKYGKKGAKTLRELKQLDEAAHLEKQSEKAITEIEKQTDINVSKMSDTEIDAVAKKIKNKAKTVKELEVGIAKVKHKPTQNKLTKLLKQGDEVSQNAVQEYLGAYNINNRVIKNKGALQEMLNKKVIEAYKERFAKFDLRDAKGMKINVKNLTETDIENLFKNKYFMKYNGKLIPLKFEAHHIIPKDLLLDEDMIELRNFVSRNKEIFDFNGLDNGIPVHKVDSKYEDLGGHSSHPEYNKLSREKVAEIKAQCYDDEGIFDKKLFDKKLLNYINKTREKIIAEVISESKKINNLKL